MDYQEASDLLDRTSVMPVAPIKAERWRNVAFDKAGNSYRGKLIYLTEAQAYIDNTYSLYDLEAGKYIGFDTVDGPLIYSDLAFVLQMPVTE